MAEIFLSPGVYTREQDFSAYASTVGITKLGLVGLTLRGPAFEPIKISTTDQFITTFGGTDTNLQLPYVANAYLTQGNQLTVVRVLGNEGYTNSNAWVITSSAVTGSTQQYFTYGYGMLAGGRDAVAETRAFNIFTVATGLTYTNYNCAFYINNSGNYTYLGSSPVFNSSDDASAAAQNLATGTTLASGYTLSYTSGNTFKIQAPVGLGAAGNGIVVDAFSYHVPLTTVNINSQLLGGSNSVAATSASTTFNVIVGASGGDIATISIGNDTIGTGTLTAGTTTETASQISRIPLSNSYHAIPSSNDFTIFAPAGSAYNGLVCTVLPIGDFQLENTGYTTVNEYTNPAFDEVPLCIIRSKKVAGYPDPNAFEFIQESDVVLVPGNATSNPLSSFVISGITSSLATNPITVSLDETQSNYIVKVLGKNPMIQNNANEHGLYVEAIYPHYLRQYAASPGLGLIVGINSGFTFNSSAEYTNYASNYTNSVTPWVVSNIVGNKVKRLFRAHTIADGDSSASEIKISIANIDYANFLFDIYVRQFTDTDASAGSTILEAFRSCSLDPSTVNYFGNLIGTIDEVYPQKSKYITLEIVDGISKNVVPAGFEGYPLITSNTGSTKTTGVVYKTGYTNVDSVAKAFLGISELAYNRLQTAYNSINGTSVTISNSVKTLEADLFKFRGNSTLANTVISLGFHLENCSNTSLSGSFVSTSVNSITGYTKAQAKFTLVPFGGFDGFNPYKNPEFRDAAANFDFQTDYYNVQQLKTAIDMIGIPEAVDINLFALPGVNFYDSANSVRYALNMVEERADSLYVIDAPQFSDNLESNIVTSELASTGIDSNYAATYWPWVQILDQNLNQYVYIAPTAQVVQSIAYTDNVSYPWFAPAGFNRGLMNVTKAQLKLTKTDRDTLYDQRINPIATFVQQGVVIFGQKTLQQRQSALDRINVRRLLLQIRKVIAAASQTLLFEQNDTVLQAQFKSKVDPILLQIQNNRGLYGYKIVMDSSNNTEETIARNTLVGKIQLKPTRTAEFIDLTFQVLPTGANFSDF